jgi:tetratricopeptide (TPR) repeat protein
MTTTALYAAGEKPRPSGIPEPPSPDLRAICDMISSERFTEALEALFDLRPKGLNEVLWTRYLKGAAMIGDGEYEGGLDEFNFVLGHTDALDRSEEHREAFRIAGLCLKKIGWYCRLRKEYDHAILVHEQRYDLADRYGSHEELHDAAKSLHENCILAGRTQESAEWLQRIIVAEKKIASSPSGND